MFDASASRRVAVDWLEQPRAWQVMVEQKRPLRRRRSASRANASGFTILELMLVIAIIGAMMALALPHLVGFGKSNSMNAATRQLLDDCALARQRALVNRAEVYMVFVPPPAYWTSNNTVPSKQFTNIASQSYTAYALISGRTVGDQPGRSYPHYVVDWKTLPQGVYIAPFEFTNTAPTFIGTTNTLTSATNEYSISPFVQSSALPTAAFLPFPSTYNGANYSLPCICFSPRGQLLTSTNQYIVLASGSVFSPPGTFPPNLQVIETPSGNSTNVPNIIAIDALTARAQLQQNHF
jgi:prepilin-type N-terminal cleavage/methylation domain-containing protein